jgi:hypothetical protein
LPHFKANYYVFSLNLDEPDNSLARRIFNLRVQQPRGRRASRKFGRQTQDRNLQRNEIGHVAVLRQRGHQAGDVQPVSQVFRGRCVYLSVVFLVCFL